MTVDPPILIAALLRSIASSRLELVDLTSTLRGSTPIMTLPDPFASQSGFVLEQLSRYDEHGPGWYHNNIHTGEHSGTHLDAPIHWLSGKEGRDVASIPLDRLIGPACVIDVREQVDADPDFLLQRHHVEEWEARHGQLQPGSWLLLRTGWDRYSDDQEAFVNADENGPHSPGVSGECALWLAEERPISGFGADTLGIDAGRAGEFDPPFPMHNHLLGHDKYGITSLQNLSRLPETGALLIVAPLRIEGGSGSPARVIALTAADSA
ncbi:putative cyclase [Microbacterium sp. C448]|uniref:cyclase family protein n=1 Tax=Microbacterium TaxID=33882 RepID=UPI0003DE0028|nr:MULTISPECIES: cyclase family protein [Microbacterium]CDK01937.1 putative cyclase [Microbacterium sp. C448]